MVHRYTPEQKKFVSENIKGRKYIDLLEMFNGHFGTDIKINQLRAFIKNNGLSSGLNFTFKPGSVPFNKGKKGLTTGGEATQFKKGNRPHSYKPVGTERVNGEGYVDIKVADPNKWRAKHLLLWEKENGPVPKGHVVIFGDGDRLNVVLDNLILISRKQLAIMNRNSLISDNAEMTKTGIIIADIYSEIGKRKKGGKNNAKNS